MNEWPIFSREEVIVGNLESKWAIATLWTPREKFVETHKDILKYVSIIGNLYSVYGIGILVRNLLSNPNLRRLIITGTNLGSSKSVMEKLINREGIADIAPKLHLSEKHLEIFLEKTCIYFLEKKDEIIDFILKETPRNIDDKIFPQIVLDLPEPKADSFPTSNSGHLLRVRTIEDGYKKLLKEIRLFGHITNQDSEGQRRQELWELNMVINDQNPQDFSSIPHPEYNAKQIQRYSEDFWNGTEPEDLAYRYGHIIRSVYGDQVKAVKQAFKDKAETFRTVMSLWNPCESIKEKDPPCITIIHPRIIGDSLHLWAYIRTNDMFGGWPLNAMALRYFQYKLLGELKTELHRPNLELGELGITSGSAHIYERNWLAVDSFLGEDKPEKFYPDPKGNFEVRLEEGLIIVNHYNSGGEELLQVFKGNTARELSKKIEPFISQINNALYIGRELQKLEMEAKNVCKCNC